MCVTHTLDNWFEQFKPPVIFLKREREYSLRQSLSILKKFRPICKGIYRKQFHHVEDE